MVISELFTSLQGEGALVGVPSFFIRTSGCNLRCRWCDTPYTSWKPEFDRMSVSELLERASATGLRHVVVTGGEPLLQREIGELTFGLAELGMHVTVETAGTVAPHFHCDLLSLSPKLADSDPVGHRFEARHRRQRLDSRPLTALVGRFALHQLKFVVSRPSDVDEIEELIAVLDIDREAVQLMPEGRSAAEVADKAEMVAGLCLDRGFRYTPRLHLDLFGPGRGV